MLKQPILLAACLLLSSTAALAETDRYQVSGSSVNVRSGPGTHYRILFKAQPNEAVVVSEEKAGWANLTFVQRSPSDTQGWIHKDFLSPVVSEVSEAPVESTAVSPDVVGTTEAKQATATDLTTETLGAYLDCLPNNEANGVGSCMLDIDLNVAGGDGLTAVEVRCEAEFDAFLRSGEQLRMTEVGRIRTPVKDGVGAARMQLMVFPLVKERIESISLADYQCQAKPG